MTEIVTKMRSELRDILRDSVVDYTTKARDKWLFDWPSQIILVVNQVFWCQEVEQVCHLLSCQLVHVWLVISCHAPHTVDDACMM